MKLRENQIRLLDTIKAEMDKLILHRRIMDAEMFVSGLYRSVASMDEKEINKTTTQAQEDEWWGDIKPRQLTAEEQAEEDEMWGDIKPSQEFKKAPPKKVSEEYTPLLPLLGSKPPVFNLDTMREFADNVELVLKSA